MRKKLLILPGLCESELFWDYQKLRLNDAVDPEIKLLIDQDSIQKMADEALQAAPDRFFLCGHSLGSLVAMLIAAKAPNRVEKLILVSAFAGATHAQIAETKELLQLLQKGKDESLLEKARKKCIHPDRWNDPELMDFFKTAQLRFPQKGALNQIQAILQNPSVLSSLSKIQCPTLVVYGRQDALMALKHEEAIVKGIPNAKLALIEDCGHMPSIERPQALTALMRLWLT